MNHHLVYNMVAVLLYLNTQLFRAHSGKFPTALTIKESMNDFNEEEEEEDNEDSEVFYPTNKWQTLKPGQSVPAGSHVRLNLQTGQREAKLGQGNDLQDPPRGKGTQEDKQTSLFMAEELKEAVKKFKRIDFSSTKVKPSLGAQFRSVEELKKDMAALHFKVETDAQIMSKLLSQLNDTKSTVAQRVTALINLEYLVHQVDNAQNLVPMGGMALVIDTLNSTDVRLQESAAFVLGSAISSNPSVQVVALEHGTLQTLLTLLATQRPVSVKKKVLFALACLLRHMPLAQSQFVKLGGLQVLQELFLAHGAEPLRVRIITMLYDMVTEKEFILQNGVNPVPDVISQEHWRQYGEVSLLPMLVEQGWCTLVPGLLDSPDHDKKEKALRMLLAMTPHCHMQYLQNPTLSTSLSSLYKQYQTLTHQEKNLQEIDGYFGEILALVDSLIANLHKEHSETNKLQV